MVLYDYICHKTLLKVLKVIFRPNAFFHIIIHKYHIIIHSKTMNFISNIRHINILYNRNVDLVGKYGGQIYLKKE